MIIPATHPRTFTPDPDFQRTDIHQQVTDKIIQQLEAGTIPWQRPWNAPDERPFAIPQNYTTGKQYQGINIVLLWFAAMENQFTTDEWGSFKQWQSKKECIRKGEKGSMIVYYDMLEREVQGELKKVPFIKKSIVFNRSQLLNYRPEIPYSTELKKNLVDRIEVVDGFIKNTSAIVEHHGNSAFYNRREDKIVLPLPEAFENTAACTATEGYYSTLLHELTHWTGNEKRINRNLGKSFGDEYYATEELVGELGAAFLCAEFDIAIAEKGNHASYIANWLKVLRDNKKFIFWAASEASKAVEFMKKLQPKPE